MRISLVVCVTLAVLACTPEDILVARTPSADGGGPTTPDSTVPEDNDASTMPSECSSNADCDPMQYCAKAGCEEAHGVCTSRPTLCELEQRPVCGCDEVNYFNDCLRRANGVASASEGECGKAGILCGLSPNVVCPNGGYCAKFDSGPYCLPGTPGHCWVLPDECGEDHMEGEHFVTCDDGPGGEDPACVDLCRAIRSEKPYSEVDSCPL